MQACLISDEVNFVAKEEQIEPCSLDKDAGDGAQGRHTGSERIPI